MTKRILTALGISTLVSTTALAGPPADADPALWALDNDKVAWEITEGLTTEVGARQAGTEAEARGRAWALNYLRKAGFANIREEAFDMPTWVRGEERASVISPFPQKFAITALGNSGSTGPHTHNSHFADIFALDLQRIEQASGSHNRGTMLIIMEYRNIAAFNQLFFDFKAFGRFNIFQINTTEGIGDIGDGIDEVFRGAMCDFNINRI